jgi:hypothetical protein
MRGPGGRNEETHNNDMADILSDELGSGFRTLLTVASCRSVARSQQPLRSDDHTLTNILTCPGFVPQITDGLLRGPYSSPRSVLFPLPRYCFVTALGYLSFCQITRVYVFDYGMYSADFTG